MTRISCVRFVWPKICVSSAVQKEMDRLTTRPFRSCIPKMELPKNQHSPVVKVLYLNIRPLHAHFLDLKHDQCCLQADIIAIAETRLTQADTDTLYELDGYNLYRFDYESGAALQHRPSKYPLRHMNRLTIQKDIQVFSCSFNSGNLAVQLAFLYVPPKYHSLANQKIIFDGIISSLHDISDIMTIICGDFNHDLFLDKTVEDYVLKSYNIKQVIDEVTTDYGTLLDHMYTNIPTEDILCVGALETYYSDHKPNSVRC